MSTFYDVHVHALNLSHPSFHAFVDRFKPRSIHLLLGSTLVSLLSILHLVHPSTLSWLQKKGTNLKNLLSVLENDIGSFFLLTEDCLREAANPLLRAEGLHIGGKTYSRIVLTPLMMDFGCKGIRDVTIHYNQPARKPIVEQVVDVFNAVKTYKNAVVCGDLPSGFPSLGTGAERVFEIYPFLGLNTKNYDMERLQRMLEKYFGSYSGLREDFYRNLGAFDGDIEHIGSNFFAGVKVYPRWASIRGRPADGEASTN